jgi:maleamate amidohydrolase
MIESRQTAKEIFQDIMANPKRKAFGFGAKAALINIDLQKAYTRPDLFSTAYTTDPNQIGHINTLAELCRQLNWPVIWTSVSYSASGDDAGVWGTRSDNADSLQNIKHGSERAALDDRLLVNHDQDVFITKKMPSVFFETQLPSLLTWYKIDTVILTGGSTSGCVRASAVESLSRGYRTIVPLECVADKHESYHYANLTDMALKYADVLSQQEVAAWLYQKNLNVHS